MIIHRLSTYTSRKHYLLSLKLLVLALSSLDTLSHIRITLLIKTLSIPNPSLACLVLLLLLK